MSEKTIYPGAPISNGPSQNARPNQHFIPESDPGTDYPGHNADQSASQSSELKKPILGFLYSVSKESTGEFWPLYLGANTIGRDATNSVCLKESTVSQKHATLVIRQMMKQGESVGLFVFIQDMGSTCGTHVNGETLDFNPRECKNGDIITIGENYELYFMQVDPKALGLAPKENFKPVVNKVVAPVQEEWAPPVNMFSGNVNKGTLSGDSSTSLEGRMATIYRPQK